MPKKDNAAEPATQELLRVLACVEVVLYGDECPAGPCEEDDCLACKASIEVNRYFQRAGFAVSSPLQTYTLRPFDVREHMWGDDPAEEAGSPAASRPCDSCTGNLDASAPSIETTCEHCQSRAEDHWEDVQTRGYQ